MSGPDPSSWTPTEVEALLASLPGSPPREAFREALRGRFLAGESPSLEGGEDRISLGVIEEILVTSASLRPAREAFRGELRARFVAGELEAPARGRERSIARRPLLRVLARVLVAAAAILVIGLLIPRKLEWRVLEVAGDGPLRIDGVELASWDLSTLGRAFGQAESLETLGNRVVIGLGDDLVFHLRPGSRVTAGPLPGRSGEGEVLLTLEEESEIYVRTAEAYDGPPVRIRTADLDADVTGTVFGVFCWPDGSCVCVTRGEVRVTSSHAARDVDERTATVLAGSNRQVWSDGETITFSEFPSDLEHVEPETWDHVENLRRFTQGQ
ncbi:MAG: hypothetical protein O7B99_05780 [Planctomycetota bacterium]|nr:hypothetical protein [Planctomycetota bacterium]